MAEIGLDTILATLLGVEKDAAAASPYAPITGATDLIGKTLIQASPQYSLQDNILAGLLTGAVGGLAQRGTRNFANEQSALANEFLLGGLTEKPEGLEDSIFEKLKSTKNIFDKSAGRQDTRSVFEAMARASTPQERRSIVESAKQLGMLPKDSFAQAAPTAPAEPIAQPASKNLFPGSSISDARKQLIQQNIDLGLPGGAAQKEAAEQMAAFSMANKDSVDLVAKARERAKLLAELASTAQAGAQGAGETGGAFRLPRELLSSLYATVNTEEANQRASQQLLDSIGPEVIKMSRSPGAVSDFESKLLLGAGPSSRLTPEANALLLDKMQGLAAIENDYANFLEAYRAEKGTTAATTDAPGAEQLWAAYKKSNPLFAYQEDGSLAINKARTPWQQWLLNPIATQAQPTSAAQTLDDPLGIR